MGRPDYEDSTAGAGDGELEDVESMIGTVYGTGEPLLGHLRHGDEPGSATLLGHVQEGDHGEA